MVALRFDDDSPAGTDTPAAPSPTLARAAAQLDEYFAGRRTAFGLPLDLRGGPLEMRVWSELRRIPNGTTVTYGRLAEAVGRPDAVRAVAGAVARTPIPVVIPCHRVIGADGGLRGYVGGLERKAAPLAGEGATMVAATAAPRDRRIQAQHADGRWVGMSRCPAQPPLSADGAIRRGGLAVLGGTTVLRPRPRRTGMRRADLGLDTGRLHRLS